MYPFCAYHSTRTHHESMHPSFPALTKKTWLDRTGGEKNDKSAIVDISSPSEFPVFKFVDPLAVFTILLANKPSARRELVHVCK